MTVGMRLLRKATIGPILLVTWKKDSKHALMKIAREKKSNEPSQVHTVNVECERLKQISQLVTADWLIFHNVASSSKMEVVERKDASATKDRKVDSTEAKTQTVGWQSLLTFTILSLAWLVGFASRLFAVIRFESIIHEFDPW